MEHLKALILLSGIGHVGLAFGSLAIPRVMNWRWGLARLSDDMRRMFWVYSGYIWCIHLAFAAISIAAPEALLDGSILAASVCGFIAVYWGARVLVQFFYFDRAQLAPDLKRRAGLYLLELCFVGWALVYGAAAVHNVIQPMSGAM